MPVSKPVLSKRAFARDLLPLLKDIDFENTDEKKLENDRRSIVIEQNGKIYRIIPCYLVTLVELRIHAWDHNPDEVRFCEGTMENCYVYLNSPKKYKTGAYRKDILFDRYYMDFYVKEKLPKTQCFYCSRFCKIGPQKAHDKCARHFANKATVITDLAKAAKINEDCMRHIMSYLYYTFYRYASYL